MYGYYTSNTPGRVHRITASNSVQKHNLCLYRLQSKMLIDVYDNRVNNISREIRVGLSRIFVSILTLGLLTLSYSGVTAQETPTPTPGPEREYKVVGYYTSYSIYDLEYYVTDIPGDRLTHLIYSAVDISDNGQCVSTDIWADRQFSYPEDLPTERLRGNFKQLQLLREEYPDLKILMSIGAWDQSENFSSVAATEEARVRFARSCLAFMREYGFDGIDVDWRWPVDGGQFPQAASSEDRANMPLLLADLRGQLDYWGEQDEQIYLLTMTAPAVEPLYRNYALDLVHSHVDWINLLTYGFQGSWSEIASHHAPLLPNERDPRGEVVRELYNVDGAVNVFLDAGVPAEKIVIGVPFYAQTWRDVRASDYFGLYQPTAGTPAGTRPGGLLFYRDLRSFFDSPSYVRFFDEETRVPWMYNADRRIAVSYENPESIMNKGAYVRENGLGGMFAWELSFDDPQHTLLNAMYRALRGDADQTP